MGQQVLEVVEPQAKHGYRVVSMFFSGIGCLIACIAPVTHAQMRAKRSSLLA